MNYIEQAHLRAVTNAACETFGITPRQFESRARPRRIIWPRQVAITALIDQFAWDRDRIAKALGINQSTVFYSRRAVINACEVDHRARAQVQQFLAALSRWRSRHERTAA